MTRLATRPRRTSKQPKAGGGWTQDALDFWAAPEPEPVARTAPTTPPAPAPAPVLVAKPAPEVAHTESQPPTAARNTPNGTASTVPSGTVARIRANLNVLAAIRNHTATSDQLASWSGWGATPELFDLAREDLAWARDGLAMHLDQAGIRAASHSTLNAHYTDPALVEAIWAAVQIPRFGFPGGTRVDRPNMAKVLEPGCGSGNFLVAAPPWAEAATGVELDPTTAMVAQARCPNAKVITGSFAETRFPEDHFDLVIGNVPFGDYTLHDPVHNKGHYSIHNHFILKALRLTRPGGLVAVITSRYTLDSADNRHRKDMHELADLLAAVRLPGNAHQRTAGTKVVTDVLIFRRREPGRTPALADWLAVTETEVNGLPVIVNGHFTGAGARWVLGRMTARSRGRTNVLEVEPTTAGPPPLLAVLTAAAVTAKAAGLVWTPAPGSPEWLTGVKTSGAGGAPQGTSRPVVHASPPAPEPVDVDGLQEGHILAGPAGFLVVRVGQPAACPVPSAQGKELRALLTLRDAALAVLTAETRSADDTPALATLRARLNHAYTAYTRAYGALNRVSLRRTGRTDPATGADKLARVRPPAHARFRDDPHAPLVFALEDYDPESETATRAAIFTQRVIAPRTPPEHAESPADALAITLDETGRVDLGMIARLLGTNRIQAREALTGLVFSDPASPDGRNLVAAAEYLSGNVRTKLAAAELAAKDDDRYAENVTALRAVIPSDLTAAEIDARLGAAWIAASYVEDFLKEILEITYLTVKHPGGNVWEVIGGDYGVLAQATWGTKRAPAGQIAHALLEQRRVEVRDKNHITNTYVLNPEETAAAQEKAAELQDRFGEWVWEEPTRARELAAEYNRRFNSVVLRSYDDARPSLPGLSAAFRELVAPHQYAAVARITAEPSALLGHEVGAGKTAEMVMGAMELRRLGMAKKPCVVVPNHMLDQFAGEWLRLYPTAKVLVTRREDLAGDMRRRLVARIATGDWDAVIISRSAFERIPLTPEHQADYLDREADKLRDWLEAANDAGARRLTTKRLEKALAAAIERVKAKLDGKKDTGIYFEETGVDYLFVDESQGFKNLRTASNIDGASIDGSQRASDLDMKISWLRERNGNRVATFATATPIANSVAEMYVVQHYLRPDLLEDAGIDVFDTWAATFGEVVTEIELAPEGGGVFRQKTRFARFRNVPELLRMFHVFADIKTADDLKLPVPLIAPRPDDGARLPEIVTVPASDALRRYVTGLGERASLARGSRNRPGEDNMLNITTDGRKAALHLRLVTGANTSPMWWHHDELHAYGNWCQDLDLAEYGPGKVEAVAERIHQIWQANRDNTYPGPDGHPSPVRGALQLVFADLGTPRAGWNAYDDLRDRLHTLGLPEGSVRFIHDAKTDRDKAQLFAACRNGQVAVLVGSTEKMGTGTNVQHRAIALHHLDAPWRPADVAQRDGRILRQLNTHPEVQVIRYVVAGSFDGFMWQTLERKARFIAQVMRGRLDVREIEDIGDVALSYAEIKALATGNPLLMEKATADAALVRLERAERAHQRNQSLLGSTARQQAEQAEWLRARAGKAKEAIGRRTETHGDQFTMLVGAVRYTKRADAGRRLVSQVMGEVQAFLSDWRSNQRTAVVGELAGFPVQTVIYRGLADGVVINVTLDGAPGVDVQTFAGKLGDGHALIVNLERLTHLLDRVHEDCLTEAARADAEASRAEENIGAPFAKAAELAAARTESARVQAALDKMARPVQQPAQPKEEN